ncbi:TetR/AcrR family transcriptional regulator [Microbacterium sp. BR1]|uniref:TetR/AcrR family transcriptional regulator n=1 Tax=Microbacterium sp. BR1 TaxID=1070896 RepID=UPI0018E1FD23|nr:TetR/AcrR family transcriptional regulator [Microbacterium sp. BR1]
MPDRREALLDAAIAVVREGGYPALTQTGVAARAGMTQGHLTYYFPTRSDLVRAVAERIVQNQFALFDTRALPRSVEEAVQNVTAFAVATETTRALATLMLAADAEPVAGEAFNTLASGMRQRATYLLAALTGDAEGPEAIGSHALDGRLLHATAVGAAVLTLAEGANADDAETGRMLARLLELLTSGGGEPSEPSDPEGA